jgi:hypothetical protein
MINGKQREQVNFESKPLKIGLGEVVVVGINPQMDEYKEVTGIELKEDSKATEYLGESRDNNETVRIDVWVENVKSKERDKITYFLENKLKENKDGSKKQYINTVGSCSWADDPNNLPDWFKGREYRQAYQGEEELYNFMRTWLSKLDYRDADTVLQLDWKKLIKGNLKDLKDQINGEFCGSFVVPYTVRSVDKDGETKQYQSIYNKALLPAYSLKNFRLIDYSKEEVQNSLKGKKSKDLKPHERFVLQMISEYGPKDSWSFKEVMVFNPEEFLVSSNVPITMDGSDY